MSDLVSQVPKRKKMAIATTLVVAGLVLATTGLFLSNQATISADTEPPVPAEPTGVTPPTPEDPNNNPISPDDPTEPGNFTFASGWSMIAAKELSGRNLKELNDSGIYLYSYNDPYYPVTEWSVFPGLAEDGSTQIALKPTTPLGYYVYNSNAKKTVTLSASTTKASNKIFGRGWHLFYWGGSEDLTRDELLSKIKIYYSNDTTLTGAEAIAEAAHRASIKVYVVTDQNEMDLDKSVKELTGQDSATTVSKLPKNGYYWFYLRRTKDRVNSFGYQGDVVQTATVSVGESPTSETETTDEITPPVPEVPTSRE